jgi:hypothetical protein
MQRRIANANRIYDSDWKEKEMNTENKKNK